LAVVAGLESVVAMANVNEWRCSRLDPNVGDHTACPGNVDPWSASGARWKVLKEPVVGGEAWKMELDSGAVMETMEWNGWP
jgi:hypothetical protein